MLTRVMERIKEKMWRFSGIFLTITTAILVDQCCGLRLTHMTAPALQDPRKDMELHCRFDMGGEDLYAVKWYKDDHEFFRYTPSPIGATTKTMMVFPVPGVTVDQSQTHCMRDGCDLLLTDLSRSTSSGAYRCEVSSEAPAFRLASQTHNVTVAALPDTKPRIDGLLDSYLLDDLLLATCTSGLGDPKPTLLWYINKQPAASKSTRELLSDSYNEEVNGGGGGGGDHVHLKSTTIQLRLPLDRKLTTENRTRTPLEISCQSYIDGVSPIVAPPLTTTKTIQIIDQYQLVNNQKLHSPYSSTATTITINYRNNIFLLLLLLLLLSSISSPSS